MNMAREENRIVYRAKRFGAVILTAALLLISLTGCMGTNADAEVAAGAINQSPENVARVFAKATYSGDKDLLLACFPAEYKASLTEDDLNSFETWSLDTITALETNKSSYMGTSASDAEIFSKEKDPDKYQTALSAISVTFGIESSKIEEIRSCKVRVICMINKDKSYQDVEVIVYKYDGAWYADPSA
jgi:hypothetical protein